MSVKIEVDWDAVYARAAELDEAETPKAIRNAALEEAAMVADIEASTDKYATDSQAHRIAAAIRELKDE